MGITVPEDTIDEKKDSLRSWCNLRVSGMLNLPLSLLSHFESWPNLCFCGLQTALRCPWTIWKLLLGLVALPPLFSLPVVIRIRCIWFWSSISYSAIVSTTTTGSSSSDESPGAQGTRRRFKLRNVLWSPPMVYRIILLDIFKGLELQLVTSQSGSGDLTSSRASFLTSFLLIL